MFMFVFILLYFKSNHPNFSLLFLKVIFFFKNEGIFSSFEMSRGHVTNFVQNISPKIKFLKFKFLAKFFFPGLETILGLLQ